MGYTNKPKQILLSKRNYIFYVDRVKVVGEMGNVRLVSKDDHNNDFDNWMNVPHQNTSLLLLGHGSSITNEAMRLLSAANVIVGFCGTDGSPTYQITDMVFSASADNYRPTKYMQQWYMLWEQKQLETAKLLLITRIQHTLDVWENNDFLWENNVVINNETAAKFVDDVNKEDKLQSVLLIEARWTKYLYKTIASKLLPDKFKRVHDVTEVPKTDQDKVNVNITHGNYLAYGLATVALHGLGISYAFPMLHGNTRRGGLVLDVADLIKDPYVLPHAFEHHKKHKNQKQSIYRGATINMLHDSKALNYCFDTIKKIINIQTNNK